MNTPCCGYKCSKIFFSKSYFQIPYAFRSDQNLFITDIPKYDFGPRPIPNDPTDDDRIFDLKTRLCGRVFAADENKQPADVYTGPNTVSVCCKFVCLSNRELVIPGLTQTERRKFFQTSNFDSF